MKTIGTKLQLTLNDLLRVKHGAVLRGAWGLGLKTMDVIAARLRGCPGL